MVLHVWCTVVWFTCQGIITLCLSMPKIPFNSVQMYLCKWPSNAHSFRKPFTASQLICNVRYTRNSTWPFSFGNEIPVKYFWASSSPFSLYGNIYVSIKAVQMWWKYGLFGYIPIRVLFWNSITDILALNLVLKHYYKLRRNYMISRDKISYVRWINEYGILYLRQSKCLVALPNLPN